VKDNIPVRGMRATWGSRIYADWVPDKDELPIAKLRDGGAVILGKTNCPEFTLQGYTDNLVFGVTRNPWDLALTPGGSSGGAVAAVAAGFGPVAVGTDGGGSIRRRRRTPAWSGSSRRAMPVATQRRVSVILLDCEVIGPIARTVADVRVAVSCAGGASGDPPSPPAALRILYVRQFGGSPVDRRSPPVVEQAAKHLACARPHRRRGERAVRYRRAQSRLAGHQPGRACVAAEGYCSAAGMRFRRRCRTWRARSARDRGGLLCGRRGSSRTRQKPAAFFDPTD
jgi:Asp-tRNA(Asn)/Glu-tRNA(Gln) amidotransferase A subunit family amidase